MNFKKIMAGVAAGSMVAAMSVSVFAADGDCSYIDGTTPSYSYTVESDVDTITASIVYADDAEDTSVFNCNDWCANGVIVTLTDGTKNYYQWGGAQVSWGWDIDGDKVADTGEGVGTETWLGTIADRAAELIIPVEQGATVEFVTLGWDTYDGVQYTVTVSEAAPTADTAPVAYLAAIVAVAGVALVASKKVCA